MFGQHALRFGKAISDLWLMETICDRSVDLEMDEKQISDTRKRVRNTLQDIGRICANSDLKTSLGPEIRRFRKALKMEPFRDIARRCNHLRERILDELKNEYFFHILQEDSDYYDQRAPFGDAVATKFEAATNEIERAAKCLALQQPTACVFHLMRGMETAVQRLARKLKMKITPQTTWRQLTGSMKTKIEKMSQKTEKLKERRHDWEAASANLHHLGSVVRNKTMHPDRVYTQAEARHIFITVGVSMDALCDL